MWRVVLTGTRPIPPVRASPSTGGKISVSYDITKKFQPIYQWMDHISKTLEALTASPEPAPEPDQPIPNKPVTEEKLARKGEKVYVTLTEGTAANADGESSKTFESDLRGTIGGISYNRVPIAIGGAKKVKISIPSRWSLVEAGLGYMESASLYTLSNEGDRNVYTWTGKDIFLDDTDNYIFC